jgi:hypothetical protein
MLDVIARRSIIDTIPNSSTAGYMAATNSTVLPEDVYFSKTIQELGLGRVAPWDTASAFSTETQYNPNSVGGHNFWLSDPNWKERLYKTVAVQFNCKTAMTTTHRGGWAAVLGALTDSNILCKDATNDFLSVVEEVYMWNKDSLRPTRAWTGVVHCTPSTPEYYNNCNISYLVKSPKFLKDIKQCICLISLSEYVSDYLRKNIPNPPKIVTLLHPVVTDNIPQFTLEKYQQNSTKHIIQIGQQLRKVTSIFKINPSGFKRLWLTGIPDINNCKSMITRELAGRKNVHIDYSILHYTKTFEEYDALLDRNIVFIDLFDSAANNTVLECIVRNTPIILNRTPGVVEYLGAAYPLYFDTLEQVDGLLTLDKLTAAHNYLAAMNKEQFTLEYFVKAFADKVHN